MQSAKDVWQQQEERRLNRMAAMKPIIAQIQAKIKIQATHNSAAPYILYEVPTFVFGYPLYKLTEALDFLIGEYSKAGYQVWVVDKKYLMISWIKTPAKSFREIDKPVLTTNYRPQAYDNI
jgi:hypothetical protein